MSLILSTVSSQYQTTIPLNIRKQLNVSKNDKISYRIVKGAVIIEKAIPVEARLESFQKTIHAKVVRVKPGLTAREARARYAASQTNAEKSGADSHDD